MRTWKAAVSIAVFVAACGDEESSKPSNGTPAQVCERICARSAAAECENEDADECPELCQEQIEMTSAGCEGELDALTACFSSATFSCDDEGYAEAPRCDAKLEAWYECIVGDPTGPGGEAPEDACDAICAQSNEAGCGANWICESCDQLELVTPSACEGALDTLLSCLGEETYQCDGDDDVEVPACDGEMTVWATCLEDNGVDLGLGTEDPDAEDPSDEDPGSETPDMEACLDVEVPDGYCEDPAYPVGRDCPAAAPAGDCVLSDTGAANVYCCAE